MISDDIAESDISIGFLEFGHWIAFLISITPNATLEILAIELEFYFW